MPKLSTTNIDADLVLISTVEVKHLTDETFRFNTGGWFDSNIWLLHRSEDVNDSSNSLDFLVNHNSVTS